MHNLGETGASGTGQQWSMYRPILAQRYWAMTRLLWLDLCRLGMRICTLKRQISSSEFSMSHEWFAFEG